MKRVQYTERRQGGSRLKSGNKDGMTRRCIPRIRVATGSICTDSGLMILPFTLNVLFSTQP